MQRARGFTLVELMVALFVLSLVAVLGWRGLDGMVRAQAQTQERADAVLALQVGLAQWGADLDALVQLPQATAIEWNGRVLRMTRRSAFDPAQGIVVAAWARRTANGQSQWLRWQSPPATTRGELEQAWQRADAWALAGGDAERAGEVVVMPLDDWQVFFFRGDAWTNPLSSDATAAPPPAPPAGGAPGARAAAVLPDGVRIVLALPASSPVSGELVRDWVSPRVSGSRP